MNNWKNYKLSEIAEIVGGGTPSTSKDDYWNGTISWLTPKDLTNYENRYISKGERNITQNGLNNSSARLLPENTVLLSSRAPIGYLAIAKNELCTNQGFKSFILDKSKVDYKFFYYLLKNNVEFLKSIGTGTTFAEVSASKLRELEFLFPDLEEQKAIAKILSSLDDKIELNQQMNATLEAMARALFKAWFVDFEPVRANLESRPSESASSEIAKLFPSEFENDLPKGWQNGTIGENFKLIMGQSPSGKTYNETGEGIVFFQGRTDFGFRYPSPRIYCTEPTRFAEQGDTLVSVRAPVGDVNMALEKSCIGRGIAALRHNSGSQSFTYYSVKNLEENLKKFDAEGTVFGSINKNSFQAIETIEPDAKTLETFEKIVGSFDSKIENNAKEINRLMLIRDALLPRLISGKIQIRE